MSSRPQQNPQVDQNYERFKEILPSLLQTHAGKQAVMHDGKVVEILDTFGDAVRFGHAQFGDYNFSVQEITSESVSLGFHSYAMHPSPN